MDFTVKKERSKEFGNGQVNPISLSLFFGRDDRPTFFRNVRTRKSGCRTKLLFGYVWEERLLVCEVERGVAFVGEEKGSRGDG